MNVTIVFAKYPFLRLCIAQIIGVILGVYYADLKNTFLLLTIVGTILYTLLAFLLTKRGFRLYNSFLGFFGLGILLCGMAWLTAGLALKWDKTHILHQEYSSSYILELDDIPVKKKNAWQVTGIVKSSFDSLKQSQYATGRVLLFIEKSADCKRLSYGDKIWIKRSPHQITVPEYYPMMDFATYWRNKHIYAQQYLRTNEWGILKEGNHTSLYAKMLQLRLWSEKQLFKYIPDEKERAVASALLLGIKHHLSTDERNAYATAGVMHVLAVSGLHVGFLLGVLLGITRYFKNGKVGRWLVPLLAVLLLWGYAMLTGLSASVLRAVLMSSLILLGKTFRQRVNLLNIVFCSAFFLLVVNPMMLFDVGFQLSYIAVIGIILFQPFFANLCHFKSSIGHWFWELTAVALAAQLATFPLSVYYFHQFPVWFWVVNPVAVVLAGVILKLGILLLSVVGFSDMLADWVGQVLTLVLRILNFCVESIQYLPFAKIESIQFSQLDVVLLYTIILLGGTFFASKSLRYLIAVACLSVLFALSNIGNWWHITHQPKLILCDYDKRFGVGVKYETGQLLFLTDSLANESFEHFKKKRLAQISREEQVNTTTFLDIQKAANHPNILKLKSGCVILNQKGLCLWWWGKEKLPKIEGLKTIIISGEASWKSLNLEELSDIDLVYQKKARFVPKTFEEKLEERGVRLFYVHRNYAFVVE